MARRIEPFSAKQVDAYLRSIGFVVVRQTGSHCFYQHQDGRMVPLPDPGSNHVIDAVMGKKIATGLGVTVQELRQVFGYQPSAPRASKGRTGTPGGTKATYTGPDVQHLAVEISKTAQLIHSSGACFHASEFAKAELYGLHAKLRSWHARNKGKVAA